MVKSLRESEDSGRRAELSSSVPFLFETDMYTSVVYALCALIALYALHVYIEYRQLKKTVG